MTRPLSHPDKAIKTQYFFDSPLETFENQISSDDYKALCAEEFSIVQDQILENIRHSLFNTIELTLLLKEAKNDYVKNYLNCLLNN
ncbi:MAG TPA: hypothetical protein PLQ36_01470 [Candidatus Gracilibacteria bacterium]|nr:hypothetical protein [Candidatus Gracilibacteria bacterium]